MKLMEMNKEIKNNKNETYRASLEETLEVIKPIKRQKQQIHEWDNDIVS